MTETELNISKLANGIMTTIHREDKSGRLLYLFVKKLCALSKLAAFDSCVDDRYKFIVITKNEYDYKKDKRECANCGRFNKETHGCGKYIDDCMIDGDAYSNWIPK